MLWVLSCSRGAVSSTLGWRPRISAPWRSAAAGTQPVRIIPAAAAPDNNHGRAAANGVGWFQSLGAADVRAVDVIDRASADRPDLAREIERARLVFVLGGFTRYLAETLSESLAWQAMVSAHRAGAVIGGSSAGAMVMCEHYFDPTSGNVLPGLNLLPKVCVLPHHDTFGKDWAPRLTHLLPGRLLIGIDEETGLLNDGEAGAMDGLRQGRRDRLRTGRQDRVPTWATVRAAGGRQGHL